MDGINMNYTVDTPIVHAPTGTLAEALAWMDTSGKAENEYATELWRLCNLLELDAAVLFAQWAWETGDGSSYWWLTRRNPAGIGITGDPEQNDASHTWANGTEAAQAHIVHMIQYVYVVPPAHAWDVEQDYEHLDPRKDAVTEAGYLGTVRTINDLAGKWATDTEYAQGIVRKLNAIFQNRTEVKPVGNELRVILNPGHRNTTGGNEEERDMTPALAQSYFEAFTAAGYETVNLGDTAGGLDETCRRMAAMIASAPGRCVLLDLHYEGSAAPGVFAIVPDVTGLTTGAPVPQDPLDTWENNRKDTELGNSIAVHIAQATGLQLRQSGVRTPGLMDESQTGVGGEGFRLATFAYTSPYRLKAVRLVVEHGNHTIQPDRAIIMQPDFTDKCAAAAVAAVKQVYGNTTPNPIPDWPKPAPVPWKPGKTGDKTINGVPALAFLGEATARTKTTPMNATGPNAEPVGPSIEKGTKFDVMGSYRKGGRGILLRASDGARLFASHFGPQWPLPPRG